MRAIAALLVAALPMAVPSCSGPPSRSVTCGTTNQQLEVRGPQPARTTPLSEHTTLKSVGATWTHVGDYQVTLEGVAPGACMVGGTLLGEWPDSDPWTKWHYRAGIRFSQPDFSVIGVHVYNEGDGIKVKDGLGGVAQNFVIAGSWVQHSHDDCIENDYLHTGVIHDNLIDGCYVVFSSRPSSRLDGHRNLVAIDHNVAALEPMRSVYSGPSPGTGGFFKWSSQAPPVVLTDNILFARQAPNHGNLDPPTGALLCARNVIVWTGRGPFPSAAAWHTRCPDTVVTADRAWYDAARTRWLANHSAGG